ncbi:MAG: hypothetical protein KJI69_05235 [Patescibacteria group bacterium]|nr:hypothetical protein [Patescibacteria group bacterium]
MKIKKGTILDVNHSRSGKWRGIATKDFDTVKDEWYPLALYQETTVHGLNTSWEVGEEMPARRSLCTVTKIKNAQEKPTKGRSKVVPMSKFGKDHWSLLAYCETRIVDYSGVLDMNHLRGRAPHPTATTRKWEKEWGTRLKGFFLDGDKRDETKQLTQHDDYDCLVDLKDAGLLEDIGTVISPYASLTTLGKSVCSSLRKHKGDGGYFATFNVTQ